jgi:predicted RNase H-like HicB family nuclease
MLTYHATFWTEEEVVLGRVVDYPGVIAFGKSLEEARVSLSRALVDMAETALLQGEALPVPGPESIDEEAELNEPIYLVLSAGSSTPARTGAA